MIGCFFVINGILIPHIINLEKGEDNGIAINDKLSHFSLFYKIIVPKRGEKYNLSIKTDYGLFPRGRVLYLLNENKYIIYADKCILNELKMKRTILLKYNLTNEEYEFREDEHYKCMNCNEYLNN